MNNSENNNIPTSNIQNSNTVPNNNLNNQPVGNGQVLYDQYGNPVNVYNGQVQPVEPQQQMQQQPAQQPSQAQSAGQPTPQVVRQVEKSTGGKKVVYQQVPNNNTQQKNQPNQGKATPLNNEPNQKKKPGKIRYILLILFFVVLLVIVWFLPDIRKFVTERKIKDQEEVINGTMKCVYEEEDELVTTLYTSEFEVQNNKIKSYTSTLESKGDKGSEEILTKLNDDCELLTTMVKKISGIKSTCSLNSRKQTSRQEIDYSKVNTEKLDSAYAEAGGVVPDYSLDEDARDVKKEMTLAKYSCIVN